MFILVAQTGRPYYDIGYCIGANYHVVYISQIKTLAVICKFIFASGPVPTYIIDK